MLPMKNQRRNRRPPKATAPELRRRVLTIQRRLARLNADHVTARTELAEAVTSLHDDHGLTYRELGDLLGVSHVSVLKLVSHH